MPKLSQFEQDVLGKDDLSLVALNDVFTKKGEGGRPVDFDAELTTDWRSFDFRSGRYGIGNDVARGAYGVELVCNLVDDARRQLELADQQGNTHTRIGRVKRQLADLAPKVLVNNAPRDKKGVNGSDFYLGITDNGLKVVATPLEALSFVRDRLVSLFRIPTVGHPHFNGDVEQYRSSVVARSDEVPDHLVRVYGVEDLEELARNLENPDFSPVPVQRHDLQTAYEDEFGNLRLRAKRIGDVRGLIDGATRVILKVNGTTEQVCEVVPGLKDITSGGFGIYENVADGRVEDDKSAYVEVVRRWRSDNERGSGAEALGRPKVGVQVILQEAPPKPRSYGISLGIG